MGEYFTPRHIVRLMVNLVNPQFGEKVYDPTCGTGGFLIEAFKHIKRMCKQTKRNVKILKEKTVFGRELTNTARIAKMNMILTGDGHTNIKQMDSLENPLKNKYDVVFANMPYGQNTDWGEYYPIPSNQADCIFVQHILLSLNKTGRAAIIVPEGFLFRSGADERTRRYLLDNFNLWGIISLPAGVFLPYTGSKTNILIMQKGSKTEKVWFYDLKADGFELSATRKLISNNDIGDLISKWDEKPETENSWFAELAEIKSKNFNLQVKTYKPQNIGGRGLTPFSQFLIPIKNKIRIKDSEEYKQITVKLYGRGAVLRKVVKGKEIATKEQYVAQAGDLIVSKIDAGNGALAIVPQELDGAVVSSDFPLFKANESLVLVKYLDYYLRFTDLRPQLSRFSKGTTNRRRVKPEDILNIKLTIPSMKKQREIVKKLDKEHDFIGRAEKRIQSFSKSIKP